VSSRAVQPTVSRSAPASAACSGQRRLSMRVLAGSCGSQEANGIGALARAQPGPVEVRSSESAGCGDGGPSSSRASISTIRNRVRLRRSSRSADGGLASSCRASRRSCSTRESSGSATVRKSRLGRSAALAAARRGPRARTGRRGTPPSGCLLLLLIAGVVVAEQRLLRAFERALDLRPSTAGRHRLH
jgi:hypothetical protein